MKDGIVVGDGGYLSQAKAKELAQRGVYLLTATRKNMRILPASFSWHACNCATAWRKSSRFSRMPSGRCAPRTALLMPYVFTCCAVYWPIPCTSP